MNIPFQCRFSLLFLRNQYRDDNVTIYCLYKMLEQTQILLPIHSFIECINVAEFAQNVNANVNVNMYQVQE